MVATVLFTKGAHQVFDEMPMCNFDLLESLENFEIK